ncbi:gluconolactonase [Bacterioplanes sanyensis]|uniref:Gluconolactonase n=1 Tax=Bacterioplanes sanyensis TaxID=1249553 RepID=A0A222FGF2_9GAMM|nr:SMP-30/gluconolactonase/LRE family protein [Bacterioplanes sanyensis]ASP38078.1 gluconolactonase [Bacterioplanes sanyensis]
MKTLLLSLTTATLVVVGILFMPSPIDSIAVTPSQAIALEGPWHSNDALQAAQITALPPGQYGGEDVARDKLGCLYTGTEDGSILRKCPYSEWEQLLNTGGRPLGLAFDQQQHLIIADADKGLLRMTPKFELQVLANKYQGQPLGLVDDVDIGSDGTVYFSDASTRFSLDDVMLDILDGRPSGRLFAYHPATGKLELLAQELAFANGVAVAADQSYVLVNETFRYRTSKVWLAGERRGQVEPFLQALPGLPDGIARADNGTYWLAFYGLRPEMVDRLHQSPWLKNQLAKLPKALAPVPPAYGLIVQVGSDGQVLQTLHDQAAVAIGGVTSVQPEKDGLYLGTLHMNRLAKLPY